MAKAWKWILLFLYAGFGLVYHKFGDPNSEAWSKAFWIWMCAVHVVMLITICADDKALFYQVYPMILYAGFRLVVEVATISKPLAAVNNPLITDALLYMCAGATGLLICKEWVNDYYKKSITKP